MLDNKLTHSPTDQVIVVSLTYQFLGTAAAAPELAKNLDASRHSAHFPRKYPDTITRQMKLSAKFKGSLPRMRTFAIHMLSAVCKNVYFFFACKKKELAN